tara:strand:+ start:413 stop:649 length:237 start_codon:yes stop_codon:yes gene_type:complete
MIQTEEQQKKEDNIITINDKEYNEADLSQDQQYMLLQLKDLQSKRSSIQFQMDQVIASSEFFTRKLIEDIDSGGQLNS